MSSSADGLPAVQLPAKLLQAQAHASLDRAHRRVEHRGYLDVRESSEVRQLDDAPLLEWQLLERPAQLSRGRVSDRLQIGALGGLESFLRALLVRAPAVVHAAAAQGVDRAVVDDAERPRAHAAARAVIAARAAP